MSDTRGMLQAAPIRIELLIKNEANQNRNKKVLNKVDASRRAEKCRSLRVKVEVGVSGCA